jgi:hypothetical protein
MISFVFFLLADTPMFQLSVIVMQAAQTTVESLLMRLPNQAELKVPMMVVAEAVAAVEVVVPLTDTVPPLEGKTMSFSSLSASNLLIPVVNLKSKPVTVGVLSKVKPSSKMSKLVML